MHKPKPTLVNETHEILTDFEIEVDCLVLTRKSNLVVIF